ncbi:MAG: NIPSNAP family protein [Bryobacteraceae bacterium]
MKRRSFVQSVAAASMLAQTEAPAGAQASDAKTRLYRIDYFYYRQGNQANRLSQFFSSQAPLFLKHMRSLGVFTAVMAPHAQTMMVLSGFAGAEDMTAAAVRIEADPGYRKAHAEFEGGAEPPFDSAQRVLLQATAFSPEIASPPEKPKAPRYFELRVYHAPTLRQLAMVHERFAGPEIQIFHRSGVYPILYADTIIGPDLPNLTYLIPFASLADREKAWDAFNSDPEWVKVRAESVARGGQIVDYNNISLWRATAYSPIQ